MFIIPIYLFSEIFPGVSRGPSVFLAPGPINQFGRHCTMLQTDNHISTPSLFFTGRMTFLPPNQQRQSTEGIHVYQ